MVACAHELGTAEGQVGSRPRGDFASKYPMWVAPGEHRHARVRPTQTHRCALTHGAPCTPTSVARESGSSEAQLVHAMFVREDVWAPVCEGQCHSVRFFFCFQSGRVHLLLWLCKIAAPRRLVTDGREWQLTAQGQSTGSVHRAAVGVR